MKHLTLIVAFASASLIFWTIPYDELSMLSRDFLLKWVFAAAVGGAIGSWMKSGASIKIARTVTLGFVISVAFRFLYDVIWIDSSRHNLIPFEFIITMVTVFPPAFVGAWVADMVRKTR